MRATRTTRRGVAATQRPVQGIGFSLLGACPAVAVLDGASPWQLALPVGVLVTVLLVVVGLLLRSKVQAMVLGAHLEEASTQRRRLEEKNRLLEKEMSERLLLTTAVEQSTEAIIITKTDGAIQYVNPAFERITGYSAAEVLGQAPKILKSGKQDAAFYRRMWETLENGGVWTGNLTNRRKDGALYEEEAEISPVRDASGRIMNYVAVKRDVTERLAMEARLRQSQKLEAIGELAGGVAHDFNNLLTAIMGHCRLLTYGAESMDSLTRESVEAIMKAGDRAASLTRQLLAFSRQQGIRPELLDLATAVGAAEKLLRRLIPANIEFELDLPPEPAFVEADPVQVDQIIINLTVNARDAMSGGGKLTMAVSRLEAEEDDSGAAPSRIVLEVSDNGSGMDEETKARIFEPFFTTKGEGDGTGLGLSTVYGIVKQNHGDIEVDSQVGVGTTFRITFPEGSLAPSEEGAQDHDAAVGPVEAGASEGGVVLLVDDEESVLTMVRRVLENGGYTVHAALTDRDALELWRQHEDEIGLLLADIVMPGMSGIELGVRIRKERPDLGILLMSAYTDASVIDPHAHSSEGMLFLQKPFMPEALLAKVREAMAGECS